MLVSMSRIDRRHCPACDAAIASEIWLILHRHERPKLWQRSASLRTLRCPNGHESPVRAPLVLFDPGSPFIVYSPADDSDQAAAHAVGELLIDALKEVVPLEEKATLPRVEMVWAGVLPLVLDNPRLNLGDLAPGTPESEEALLICSDIRSGRASPEWLRGRADDQNLHPALHAGLRFEIASYLGRQGLHDPAQIEAAITEWRQVLRLYPRSSEPRRWAICCLELAFSYANRRVANREANAHEALRLLDAAMEILTADRYPEDFALASSRKANLLLDLGSTPELVEQSLAAFEGALSVYNKESYSDDWTLILSNMATAYLSRGGYSGFDDLRRAVALMDQVLTVLTREIAPESWAVTQMNRGLALIRLPASDAGDHYNEGVEALRAAYEVFCELEEMPRQLAAAFNLGLALARSGDPAAAEEACNLLEECLPWLLETRQTEYRKEAINFLSQAFMTSLRSEVDTETGEGICRRALAVLQSETGNESAAQAVHHVGTWLLRRASGHPEYLDLAETAFERTLASLQASDYPELRAAALANFAAVLLMQDRGSRELNRVRARDSLDEALRILRDLPTTPEREEWIGLILTNRIRSDLGGDLARKR